VTVANIPPQDKNINKLTLNELYKAITKQENIQWLLFWLPAILIPRHQDMMPNFHHHVSLATRDDIVLDHCYSIHKQAYKALPRPPLGKSDHDSVLLLPVYKQKLKQEIPVTRSGEKWSPESEIILQDCFNSADWNMFQDSDDNINKITTSVSGFIRKCKVPRFPNQKPWTLRLALTLRIVLPHTGLSQTTLRLH
jgi:hypothetical protein